MKNIFFLLGLILCFVSCNKKEKYQGQWTNWFWKNSGYNETRNVVIKMDSITFNYPYFDYPITYYLQIENRKVKFNDMAFKASIEKDTLTLNDSIYFVKDESDTLYGTEILLKIDLPEISELDNNYRYNDDIIINILFGKKIKKKELSLQLNDSYAEMNDLPEFASSSLSCVGKREELIPFYSTYLFVDRSSPMKFIEDIFYHLKLVNNLKVCFINKINLVYHDSLGLHYDYQKLTKKLPPFREGDNYTTKTKENAYAVPPPPPLSLTQFDGEIPQVRFVYLKDNKIVYNNKTIKSNELKTLVKPWIENNDAIFSLYDLDSDYGHFLEMTATIDNVYDKVRQQKSKSTFNKPLVELARDEYEEILMMIRMYHIWSYSIPHFNHIVENNNSFFGLKVPFVDSAFSAE